MSEIEQKDVNDFYAASEVQAKPQPDVPCYEELQVAQYERDASASKIVIRRSNDKPIVLKQIDHEYTRDDQEQELKQEKDEELQCEFYVEEEYLTDETTDSTVKINAVEEVIFTSKKKSAKRKPDQMYNEDFIAKSTNPRRRRVTINKSYPKTDEGTRERFVDLIRQSIECILPTSSLPQVEGKEIIVEKDSELSWAVYCPICQARIRLPVVFENSGRYCNYKRSNFERHLRFKHCKKGKEEIFFTMVSEEDQYV